MNPDKNAVLYEKMAAEQDKFRDWLKSQSPEESREIPGQVRQRSLMGSPMHCMDRPAVDGETEP